MAGGTRNHPLIFLDFDGVVHPVAANGRYFRAENTQALERSLAGLDVSIVITSTWRLDKSIEELKTKLGRLGPLVAGVTPEVDDPFLHHVRHCEVELFLESAGLNDRRWLAVDDNPAFYRPDAPLVLTDGTRGFTDEDGQRLRALITLMSTSHP